MVYMYRVWVCACTHVHRSRSWMPPSGVSLPCSSLRDSIRTSWPASPQAPPVSSLQPWGCIYVGDGINDHRVLSFRVGGPQMPSGLCHLPPHPSKQKVWLHSLLVFLCHMVYRSISEKVRVMRARSLWKLVTPRTNTMVSQRSGQHVLTQESPGVML